MYSEKKKRLASSCSYRNRFTLRNFRITQRNATQRNRTDPEKPIEEPLYFRVDFVSIYTLRLPRHQPLAVAYSEIFKFGGLPIIPARCSTLVSHTPHWTPPSSLSFGKETRFTRKNSQKQSYNCFLRSSCILFHKTWRSCLTAPHCKL